MKLYLMQHGQALSKEEDAQRPLSGQGAQEVERLARFLEGAGVRVARVIHSGKLRACQTAGILAAAIAPGVELEESGLLDPNEDPRALDWQSDAWDRDTLIVGHLPYMARLVSHLLLDEEETVLVDYEPGTLVCLVRGERGAGWRIHWMVRPALLGGGEGPGE